MSWIRKNNNIYKIILSILIIIGSLIIALILGELCVRFFKPQATYSELKKIVGGYYQKSTFNTFELKKNYRGAEPSMEKPGKSVVISTNSDGYRGARDIDWNKKNKILLLGDSYTFGLYLNDNETYPAILDNLISFNNKNSVVINAGFTDGHETDQQYSWLKNKINLINPKVIVLGVFLGNDILGINKRAWKDLDSEGLPTKWINDDLEVTSEGYLKNKTIGVNTVGTSFIYKIPLLRELNIFILFARVWDKYFSKPPAWTEEGFQHIFGIYSDEFKEKEEIFLHLISSMNKACENHKIKFIVVLLPINFSVEPEKLEKVLPKSKFTHLDSVYYERLENILKNKNIDVLNIEKKMKTSAIEGFFPKNGEVHFNSSGSNFTAHQVYEKLLSEGYIK